MVEVGKDQIKNLEGRRRIRGDDNAVLEIGSENDQKRLLSVLKNPGDCSRDDLLNAMFVNYSGEAYGDNQWPKTTGGWVEELIAYGIMRNIYPELTQLSLDIGFMTHLPQIMEIIKNDESVVKDYLTARSKFKEKLGTKIMYRGTMLTDEEIDSVEKQGLLSSLPKYIKDSPEPKEEFEAKTLSVFARDAVDYHFHGENWFSPFISVSAYEDVAIAVGRHFAGRGENKKFYLFKLQVPEIDLISYKDDVIRMPSGLKRLIDYNPNYSIKVTIDGNDGVYKWDEKVESYMFWKIDRSEMLEITQPNVKESMWAGKNIKWN